MMGLGRPPSLSKNRAYSVWPEHNEKKKLLNFNVDNSSFSLPWQPFLAQCTLRSTVCLTFRTAAWFSLPYSSINTLAENITSNSQVSSLPHKVWVALLLYTFRLSYSIKVLSPAHWSTSRWPASARGSFPPPRRRLGVHGCCPCLLASSEPLMLPAALVFVASHPERQMFLFYFSTLVQTSFVN